MREEADRASFPDGSGLLESDCQCTRKGVPCFKGKVGFVDRVDNLNEQTGIGTWHRLLHWPGWGVEPLHFLDHRQNAMDETSFVAAVCAVMPSNWLTFTGNMQPVPVCQSRLHIKNLQPLGKMFGSLAESRSAVPCW